MIPSYTTSQELGIHQKVASPILTVTGRLTFWHQGKREELSTLVLQATKLCLCKYKTMIY